MSRKASQFQKKVMSLGYRGKEVFKPLNTGWIDEHVACVREWIANIFFYTKDGTTIMIDAGYSYERLGEKMAWLDIDPAAGRARAAKAGDLDRLEQEKLDFHYRVYEGYRLIAEKEPDRVKRIDASDTVDNIRDNIYEYLDALCRSKGI